MARSTVPNKPARWLAARWLDLFAALAQCETEEQVVVICEAELNAWRERPNLNSEQSLRRPITDSLAEIERLVAVGELSQQQGAWSHKHLNFTKEKWVEVNQAGQLKVQEQQKQQQFLTNVDAIVQKLALLLESEDWSEIAVGLAGTMGGRLIEVLQTMELEQLSPYIVKFWGQAKKKGDEEFPPYEKPTLVPAGSLLRALGRLRALLPTEAIAPREISRKFGKKVIEAVNRHFAELIPPPPGQEDLYTHLFRSIYARIATYYYAPLEVTDLSFFCAVCGHFELLKGTEEQRLDFAATQHYVRYQILSADGQLDGRHGIKLGEKGVKVLQVFQKRDEDAPVKKEKGYAQARLALPTERRLKLEAARRGISGKGWADETINAILNDPAATGGELIPEQLVAADIAQSVRAALGENGDFKEFLETALRKEARFQKGVDTRYETLDVASMPTSKLAGIRHIDAAHERFRRAVAAIAAHNDKVSSPNDRWYINTTTIHNLVGGKFTLISAYLDTRTAEIKALNDKYALTPLANRKQAKIDAPEAGPARVVVPE